MRAMTDLPGTDVGHARWAIAAAFFTQGLVFISLTTRLPRIQDRWDLGELALSGVLLMMVLLAGARPSHASTGSAESCSRRAMARGPWAE